MFSIIDAVSNIFVLQNLFYFLVFLGGLFIGSFLNVVADRVISGRDIIFDRSKCDSCGHLLGALDLIPLLSYLKTSGKCSHCGKSISAWYPASEILTGLSFVYAAVVVDLFGSSPSTLKLVYFIYLCVVLSFYIILFLTDAKYGYLPNLIVVPAIAVVALFLIINSVSSVLLVRSSLLNGDFGRYLLEAGYLQITINAVGKQVLFTFISALGIGLFFYLLTKIKNGEAMGGGDVKLAFLIGLFHIFPNGFLAIFLGFLSGALYSFLLILQRKKGVKDTIPFGPFLILGSYITLGFGSHILTWYFSLF